MMTHDNKYDNVKFLLDIRRNYVANLDSLNFPSVSEQVVFLTLHFVLGANFREKIKVTLTCSLHKHDTGEAHTQAITIPFCC